MSNMSLTLLLETCRSSYTKTNYIKRLNHFKKFLGMELDDFVELDNKTIEKHVMMYIIELKKIVNPNTVPTYLTPVRSFLIMNDVLLNWKKIQKFFPNRVKLTGQSAYSTEDVQKMLNVTTKLYNKALIHVLASTGCRVGAIGQIKMKNIRDVEHGCKMIKIYAGDIEEYTTFLTPEASYAVDQLIKQRKSKGEDITDESFLFNKKRYKSLGRVSASMIIKRITVKANIRGEKHDGRYNVQICHGFRKRFNTILKQNNEVNDNAIEKMMGHRNGLDGTYLQITDEELLEHFMKGVLDLTISNDQRLVIEKNQLEQEKIELEIKFEKRLARLEKLGTFKDDSTKTE